ncbi:MAG: TonB-dependent receptor [Marinifilaceae bacterium]
MKILNVKEKITYGIFTCAFFLTTIFVIAPNDIFATNRSAETSAFLMSLDEKKVSINMSNKPITDILGEMRKQSAIEFVFQQDVKAGAMGKYSIDVKNVSVVNALNVLFKDSEYSYKVMNNTIVIERKKQDATTKAASKMTMKGRVFDNEKQPLIGVTVVNKKSSIGTTTNINGEFTVSGVSYGDVFEFSFIGMETISYVAKEGLGNLMFIMKPNVEDLNEVTVVAFGSQKKESVVSAITTVSPGSLKSSNSDLTASFAGKIAGMVGWQTGGLPGALTESEMNTKFYIRGVTSFQGSANIDPLILLDGVEVSKLDLARIQPEDIESFSVLKDASATAMYGARGANGVILVTTKKGVEGDVYTTFRYEAVASMPTQEIETVDPVTYMRMYNRALMSRNDAAIPKYSVERINNTMSDRFPEWVYPQNDWYDIMFKNQSINHRFGLNVRGGTRRMQYYGSLNYVMDNGILKTDRLNQFDINVKNNTTSFRINMNVDLTNTIKLVLNTTTNLDKYKGPRVDAQGVYGMAFNASPVDFAVMYPADEQYSWPHIRFGTSLMGQGNPYQTLHTGYKDRMRYSTINRAEYIHTLDALIKGLEVRASLSLNRSGFSSSSYGTVPFLYALGSYDEETGIHKLIATNASTARRTLKLDDRNIGAASTTAMTYEGRVYHTAAWGGADRQNHQTSLTGVVQAQRKINSPPSSLFDAFEERNLSFSMRGTYGLLSRYFGEASFGYNGSERFASKYKMGFFPAAGVAWVVSKEPFMENIQNVLSFMKLRLSWGKVGNDGIIKEPRFVYLPTISSQQKKDPEPNTLSFGRYFVSSYANPNIKWEISEKYNFGVETNFFNGLIEMTTDLYREYRHNILSLRTAIPESMGIQVSPLDNIGKSKSYGVDVEGKFQYALSNDLWFILNGTFTYNRVKYEYIEEASNKPTWQQKKGHDLSQQIGYIAEGLFKDQAEIDNSAFQGGDVMPGDIRYRDLNNDGVIDVMDATFIGYPENPSIIYGFSGFFNFKNVELSFAFQGSGRRSFFINPKQISPFTNDRAMLTAIYKDHWSEDNMSSRPFWPRLSTYNITHHNPHEDWYNTETEVRKSTYFMRDNRFLRCTSIELGYNMPRRFLNRIHFKNMKIFARANNPFIISNFKVWDIELGENGFNYPIQKTYSVGINLGF